VKLGSEYELRVVLVGCEVDVTVRVPGRLCELDANTDVPSYVAVSPSLPTGKFDVVKDAFPYSSRVAVPRGVLPVEKETVPLAVPALAPTETSNFCGWPIVADD
jgi:hypothetical protein